MELKSWTRWFCFNIKLAGWQTVRIHLSTPVLAKNWVSGCCQPPPDRFPEADLLWCPSSCSLGEISWFLANCKHRCIYIQPTRIQWGQWLKYLLTLCGHSWTLPPEENFAHSVLSHHICRHRYLGFDGLSLAPVRSTKFKPKHPKSCVKKILITVTIFLGKKPHQNPK